MGVARTENGPCHFQATSSRKRQCGAELPAAWLTTIDAAPKYAEGRGVRIPVQRKSDVANIEKLAAVKVAN
jgi:hypothetical protein